MTIDEMTIFGEREIANLLKRVRTKFFDFRASDDSSDPDPFRVYHIGRSLASWFEDLSS